MIASLRARPVVLPSLASPRPRSTGSTRTPPVSTADPPSQADVARIDDAASRGIVRPTPHGTRRPYPLTAVSLVP